MSRERQASGPAVRTRIESASPTPSPPVAPSQAPFFHFEIDDFLSRDEYAALCASFPGADRFPEVIEGNKFRLGTRTTSQAFDAFRSERPEWGRLLERLTGEPFLGRLYELARPGLVRSRGLLGARPWRLGEVPIGPGGPLFARRPVRIHFEFSRLERGASVPPHTDAPEKLVSCILYFAEPSWRAEWGGGTHYYRPRVPSLRRNWHNRSVPFELLEPIFQQPFVPNRLAVFVKSRESYHAVPPLDCPEGVARNSLNFSIHRIRPRPLRKLARLHDRAASELERRQHPVEVASASFR